MKHLLILILTIALYSCETKTSKVVMTYQMTQCADPWMGADYNNDKEGTLKKFLTQKSIQVLSLSIAKNCDSSAVCLACTCKGCDLATIEVLETDVVSMEALKFKKK